MQNQTWMKEFKDQATFRLVVLNLITLGVYNAFYIKRQSKRLNLYLDKNQKIPDLLISMIILFSYLSIAIMIGRHFLEISSPVENLLKIADQLRWAFSLLWAFEAKNRINTIFQIDRDDDEWFEGAWSFIFGAVYFNYKVNQVCEIHDPQRGEPCVEPQSSGV
ncbi:DUF4234 domain-containing protein [Reinekea marinisedimentorum]|uniref:Uncharacterized protein DUF4234 n=1 Tax=Reinekea marinisedimentorum TaxID=230495 RepID=A0A4R3I2I4_9GAMM|nr:DUF4234 domain-containing protein [Reinekea marinisedimentorum]TCS39977.1 uncharacterized protein DUF4234 [Reinekea marinisedimentorum]